MCAFGDERTAAVTAQVAIPKFGCRGKAESQEGTVGFGHCFTVGLGWRFTTSDHPNDSGRTSRVISTKLLRVKRHQASRFRTDLAVRTNDCHEIAPGE